MASARHRDVGDVHRPDLVGPGDGQFPQQIGVDLVPRRRFRGVRLAVKRLDAHAFHQRGNVQPPDLEAFLDQQTLQHPAARERELHVQLVDPVHQLQISVRHRAGLVVDAAPADPQHEDLAADAQLRGGIDHLLALGNRPAFPSAPDKKSFSSAFARSLEPVAFTGSPHDLRMQGLHVDGRFRIGFRGFAEHPGRAIKKLIAPLLDLVRVDVELLRQLDHGSLALDRSYRDSIVGKTIPRIVF
jgi:hypothetical protein